MKKYLMKIIFITILIVLICSTHYSSFAKETKNIDNMTYQELKEEKAKKEEQKKKKKEEIEAKKAEIKKLNGTKKTKAEKELAGLQGDLSTITQTIRKIDDKIKEEQTIDTDITSDKFQTDLDPTKNMSEDVENMSKPFTSLIIKMTNKIMGIIQVIGGLLAIVSIGIFGFYMVATSHGPLARDLGIGNKAQSNPNAKIAVLDLGRNMLIGSVLLFSSATIVKFVFKIFSL